MIKHRQWMPLLALSVSMWAVATLYIHFLPGSLTGAISGPVGFITTFPIAWLSVILIRVVGRLTPSQLLAGVALVGAFSMMTDGIALKWFPAAYGSDPKVLQMGAAWLLWGYGVSLGIALAIASRHESGS